MEERKTLDVKSLGDSVMNAKNNSMKSIAVIIGTAAATLAMALPAEKLITVVKKKLSKKQEEENDILPDEETESDSEEAEEHGK